MFNTTLCQLQESDYFTDRGEFRVDEGGSPTLLNCLMYKLSYYRFGEVKVHSHFVIGCCISFSYAPLIRYYNVEVP